MVLEFLSGNGLIFENVGRELRLKYILLETGCSPYSATLFCWCAEILSVAQFLPLLHIFTQTETHAHNCECTFVLCPFAAAAGSGAALVVHKLPACSRIGANFSFFSVVQYFPSSGRL
jgi:hypothetical protein